MTLERTHRQRSTLEVGIFLLASLVAHIVLMWCISMLPASSSEEAPVSVTAQNTSSADPLRVRMVDEEMLPRALQRAQRTDKKPLEPKKKEEEKKPKPPAPDDTLPFVTQDTLIKEQQPDEARFSGKQAQRTERDTQSKANPGATPLNQPRANLTVKGEKQGIESTMPIVPREAATQKPSSTTSRPELESPDRTPDVVLPGGPTADHAPDPAELVSPQDSSLPRRGREDGAKEGQNTAQNLFPTMAQRAQMSNEIGDGGSFHYLKDVDEGDVTMLNQKRNRYWTFWDRMIRQVRREWDPRKELRKRDPYGNIHGVGNFYTVVAVTLNFDGSVNKLRVARSSDLEFIDDEAVRALLDAGPYPNPPEGLRDEDGLIHFKFGFNLEIVSGKVRLFNIRPEEPF